MPTFNIVCEDPGHAGRSAQPGWAATLGTSDKDGVTGYLCAACQAAKSSDVVLAREAALTAAKDDVSRHIAASYSVAAQSSLLALYADAVANGKNDRKAYIQPALDWVQTVLAAYADFRDDVEAAPTADAVRAVVLALPAAEVSPATVTAAILILS
jgi:hypothetical protein